jgi:hypothetical protein
MNPEGPSENDLVKKFALLARKAGMEIQELDYGFTVIAYNKRTNRNIIIREAFRAERDGYVGSRRVCEDILQDWLKDNPA